LKREPVTITFLGSGSAFTVGDNNYHSNILVSHKNSNLLVDCGSDVRFSLHDQGLDHNAIEAVYISHLHADHAGGLEWLGFNRKFASKKEKPTLYVSEKLVKDLWNKVLSGGMSSLMNNKASLDSFFIVHSVNEENVFHWQGIKFELIRTIHYHNNKKLAPSYGLFLSYNHTKIFITTDTQFTPKRLEKYYSEADIIFQDCDLTNKYSSVHAGYNQLVTLDKNIKAKMWLYHYNSVKLPDAKSDGFCGFVKKGQVFTMN
jgi:ribonuclease BN (tRNA processing enzyme)